MCGRVTKKTNKGVTSFVKQNVKCDGEYREKIRTTQGSTFVFDRKSLVVRPDKNDKLKVKMKLSH